MTALTPLRQFLSAVENTSFPQEFHQYSVGFDRLFDELAYATRHVASAQNYPPHNILQFGEHEFAIELALAGFDINDLDVSVERGVLSIKGTRPEPSNAETAPKYLHRGLALRSFVKEIPLADDIYAKDASFEHGILRIHLERVLPEKDKRRQITVTPSAS